MIQVVIVEPVAVVTTGELWMEEALILVLATAVSRRRLTQSLYKQSGFIQKYNYWHPTEVMTVPCSGDRVIIQQDYT